MIAHFLKQNELLVQSGVQSIWHDADSQGMCAVDLQVHVHAGAQLSLAIVGSVHPHQKISIRVDQGASCTLLFMPRVTVDACHEIILDLAEVSACATIRCFPLVWPRVAYSLSLLQSHLASSTQSDCNAYAVLQKDAQAQVLPSVLVAPGVEHAHVVSRVDIIKNNAGCIALLHPKSTIQSTDVHFIHGAAVGVLDVPSMWALRMAGVDEAHARALIIYGHILPHVQLMVCGAQCEEVQVWLERSIKNFCCAE